MAYFNCTNRTRPLFLECRRLMVLLMHSCCSGGRVLNNSIKPTTDWAGCGGGQSVLALVSGSHGWAGDAITFFWHPASLPMVQLILWCNLSVSFLPNRQILWECDFILQSATCSSEDFLHMNNRQLSQACSFTSKTVHTVVKILK